jgi:hypothetical protein
MFEFGGTGLAVSRFLKDALDTPLDTPLDMSPQASTLLGDLVMAYQLLDVLLWVCNWPTHKSRNVIAPGPLRAGISRLKRLVKYLVPLPGLPGVARKYQEVSLNSNELTQFASVPENISITLRNFSCAQKTNSSSNYNDILSQIYGAAFSLAYFRPVSHSNRHIDIF